MLAGMGITLPRYFAMYRSQGNYRREISLQQVAVAYVVAVTLFILVPGLSFAGKLSSLLTGGDDRLLYFLMFAYAFGLAVSSLLFAYYRGVKDFKRYAVPSLGCGGSAGGSVVFGT
jgi:O-antigen/teichoic acid export membrane protein